MHKKMHMHKMIPKNDTQKGKMIPKMISKKSKNDTQNDTQKRLIDNVSKVFCNITIF